MAIGASISEADAAAVGERATTAEPTAEAAKANTVGEHLPAAEGANAGILGESALVAEPPDRLEEVDEP